MHNKNYKYAPNNAINACINASLCCLWLKYKSYCFVDADSQL